MRLLSFIRGISSGKLACDARILVLGLDNAGKSTILARLSDEEITTVKPTAGFVIKSLKQGNLRINVWDVGGQKSIRSYWRNYFADTDALVYVIDSSDRRRMEETGVELQYLLEEVATRVFLCACYY
jgi:ADP-ribosylation factor-like protein 3